MSTNSIPPSSPVPPDRSRSAQTEDLLLWVELLYFETSGEGPIWESFMESLWRLALEPDGEVA